MQVGAGLGEGPAKGEDEVAYYMQQIQMLEAGKTMGALGVIAQLVVSPVQVLSVGRGFDP